MHLQANLIDLSSNTHTHTQNARTTHGSCLILRKCLDLAQYLRFAWIWHQNLANDTPAAGWCVIRVGGWNMRNFLPDSIWRSGPAQIRKVQVPNCPTVARGAGNRGRPEPSAGACAAEAGPASPKKSL
eukprot:9430334-Alexandrium_andersonii.AAC.1